MSKKEDRYCTHLAQLSSMAERAMRTHLIVSVLSNPMSSRADLDETTNLCPICAGFLIVRLGELETGS